MDIVEIVGTMLILTAMGLGIAYFIVKRRRKSQGGFNPSQPTPNREYESRLVEDFIDGRVLETRKQSGRYIFLIESPENVFSIGETVRLSIIRNVRKTISRNPEGGESH